MWKQLSDAMWPKLAVAWMCFTFFFQTWKCNRKGENHKSVQFFQLFLSFKLSNRMWILHGNDGGRILVTVLCQKKDTTYLKHRTKWTRCQSQSSRRHRNAGCRRRAHHGCVQYFCIAAGVWMQNICREHLQQIVTQLVISLLTLKDPKMWCKMFKNFWTTNSIKTRQYLI